MNVRKGESRRRFGTQFNCLIFATDKTGLSHCIILPQLEDDSFEIPYAHNALCGISGAIQVILST